MLQRISITCLLLVACASACSQKVGSASNTPVQKSASPRQAVQRVGDQIFIDGAITPQVATDFAHQLDSGVRTLVISSGGGLSPSAVQIAREVRAHGLRVVVSKACLSACAQFIFAAARERVVQPDSLVIFHNTRSSIARLGEAHRSLETEGFQKSAETDAAIEQSLYAEIGLPQSWLYQPQLEVRTACVRFARDAQAHVSDLEFKSLYAGWIPTRSLMMHAGLSFSGFWPDDFSALQHAFDAIFRKDRPFQILYGGSDYLMTEAEVDAGFNNIGVCDGGPAPVSPQ
jgi:ATP-dependent protease ClpP protease subunit